LVIKKEADVQVAPLADHKITSPLLIRSQFYSL